MELDRKEIMLQEYMRTGKQMAMGQSSIEMDSVREVQKSKKQTGWFGVSSKDVIGLDVHLKLKEVLEEALLENIRLKTDLGTMGEEVEKLRFSVDTQR